MGFWRGRGKEPPEKPAPVQLRPADRHPFSLIDGYVPLHQPEFSLYRAIREAVPVVDAAVLKLVRLAGGVGVTCQDKEAERALNHFLRTVPVGWNQKGIQAFLDSYLDCLLTCGRAVGEIVPSRDGWTLPLCCAGGCRMSRLRRGTPPWRFCWPCGGRTAGQRCCLARSCCSLPRTTPARSIRTGCPCSTACPFCRGCC